MGDSNLQLTLISVLLSGCILLLGLTLRAVWKLHRTVTEIEAALFGARDRGGLLADVQGHGLRLAKLERGRP